MSAHVDSGRQGRTLAEWTTFGLGVALIALLVGLICWQQITGGSEPVAIEARPRLELVRRAGDAYYLPIDVVNRGGAAVQDARVRVTLAPPGGEAEEVEFLVQFLTGGATAHGTAILRADPARGRLRVEAVSYIAP